jgi:ATP-dependent DNA ligase
MTELDANHVSFAADKMDSHLLASYWKAPNSHPTSMTLPLNKKYRPMEALPASALPSGPEWQYEPKWDGFRCLAFRDGKRVDLQSKAGKPLTPYFPELAEALAALPAKQFVLDGEIVIPQDGGLSFDQLLMRIHPAATRIAKLSKESPATFIVFDLLVDEKGKSLVKLPLQARRERLERFAKKYFPKSKSIRLSPVVSHGRWVGRSCRQAA